ncbi:hypothetical protein CA54_55550 [Symmachiella macrocystis]|uniref:Uncharacterized protein n=1 Tax=Symmachiella macrocystis TaxID=2527985 RepID=A0A5C6B5D6_9PLAN|nr:hypothetical protein [Symmachiella macrocystis]TWU07150.1 hypothetical protein CA54_55550 [Symmachiella macrocystis]
MTAPIDVFVFGDRENAAWDAFAPRFQIVDAGAEFTGGPQLNALVEASQSEFLAFVAEAAEEFPAVLEQLGERMQGSAELQAVLPVGRDDEISKWIWEEFPAQLATLIQPAATLHAALIRKDALTKFGPFRDVDEPLWDWFMTIAQTNPAAIASCECEATIPAGQLELPALAPAEPLPDRDWLRKRLYEVAPAGSALLAGLLQVHDYLDESHSVSQNMEDTALGDHWHGIMHRREPDYSNAKYWYRRIGQSPLFPELAQHADRILTAQKSAAAEQQRHKLRTPRDWDAFAFIDFCEVQSDGADDSLSEAARQIQLWEMLLLLRMSCE